MSSLGKRKERSEPMEDYRKRFSSSEICTHTIPETTHVMNQYEYVEKNINGYVIFVEEEDGSYRVHCLTPQEIFKDRSLTFEHGTELGFQKGAFVRNLFKFEFVQLLKTRFWVFRRVQKEPVVVYEAHILPVPPRIIPTDPAPHLHARITHYSEQLNFMQQQPLEDLRVPISIQISSFFQEVVQLAETCTTHITDVVLWTNNCGSCYYDAAFAAFLGPFIMDLNNEFWKIVFLRFLELRFPTTLKYLQFQRARLAILLLVLSMRCKIPKTTYCSDFLEGLQEWHSQDCRGGGHAQDIVDMLSQLFFGEHMNLSRQDKKIISSDLRYRFAGKNISHEPLRESYKKVVQKIHTHRQISPKTVEFLIQLKSNPSDTQRLITWGEEIHQEPFVPVTPGTSSMEDIFDRQCWKLSLLDVNLNPRALAFVMEISCQGNFHAIAMIQWEGQWYFYCDNCTNPTFVPAFVFLHNRFRMNIPDHVKPTLGNITTLAELFVTPSCMVMYT